MFFLGSNSLHMDMLWGLSVEFRVLNLVLYIITGVLYTAEFSKERDARHQTAVTVLWTDSSCKGQLSVRASNDVRFLPDRGSRLLFVTLWPLDKYQADDNSLGRRQVTLRHWLTNRYRSEPVGTTLREKLATQEFRRPKSYPLASGSSLGHG